MKHLLIALCLMALITVPLSSISDDEKKPAEFTAEGLKLIPGTVGIDRVWMRPGTDISQYKRFYLVEPLVAFKKNWQQDQNRGHPSMRVTASDMETIKSEMAELLTEVFTRELLGTGYTSSEVRGKDVMIIKPAILDLDLNAPDIQAFGTTDIITDTAGSMKLYLEIYDSVSEQILVKAVAQTVDKDTGHMQSQKKVANRAAARRMMTPWAKALSSGFSTSADTDSKDR